MIKVTLKLTRITLHNTHVRVVVVLPDHFRGMGARRNSAETQQLDHTPIKGAEEAPIRDNPLVS